KNIAIVEEEFADKIGVAPLTFPHIYKGKVPISAEGIKSMLEAGAMRAYLSRAWGDKFLRAACAPYGVAEEWLDELWPRESDRSTLPPRVLHNLPAPTYSEFVMRAAPSAAVLDGLRQRAAAVVVISLGGMGKTCLAREIAGACLRQPGRSGQH